MVVIPTLSKPRSHIHPRDLMLHSWTSTVDCAALSCNQGSPKTQLLPSARAMASLLHALDELPEVHPELETREM